MRLVGCQQIQLEPTTCFKSSVCPSDEDFSTGFGYITFKHTCSCLLLVWMLQFSRCVPTSVKDSSNQWDFDLLFRRPEIWLTGVRSLDWEGYLWVSCVQIQTPALARTTRSDHPTGILVTCKGHITSLPLPIHLHLSKVLSLALLSWLVPGHQCSRTGYLNLDQYHLCGKNWQTPNLMQVFFARGKLIDSAAELEGLVQNSTLIHNIGLTTLDIALIQQHFSSYIVGTLLHAKFCNSWMRFVNTSIP